MTVFNPPIAWVLTAAEIVLGSFIVSWGYPVFGGVVMGLAAGSFISRATMQLRIAHFLQKSRKD